MIDIRHGRMSIGGAYTRYGKKMTLPNKIRSYMLEKVFKFMRSFNFTMGHDPLSHITVVALCHPKDNFNKKIGRRIVEGRINRALGFVYNPVFKLQKTIVNGKQIISRKRDVDGNPILKYMRKRRMYDPIPEWLYILER